MTDKRFERGSEWRQWDLHIHTPASFHWTGEKFDADPSSQHNKRLVDEMIAALNNAEPAVFALMDYWTFDGWFALNRRLAESDSPKLLKTVFPGIELRLAAPMAHRLNAHVIFSDKVTDQTLHDFKAVLEIEIIKRPLSDGALIDLARRVGEDKLRHHGFKKEEVDKDNIRALLAGSTIAEINCESYKTAIEKVPSSQAVGFMPYDTNDGLIEVKWEDHYAFFVNLFKTSPIFESRNIALRDAFINEETPTNKIWIRKFQEELDNIPRLVASGSDAHRFVGIKGDNDKRGYGDFPSGKITWIKADPTFLGLMQAIKEPAKRSYIGESPKKLIEVLENKTFYIDAVDVKAIPTGTMTNKWLDGCALQLNPDLVAIIGNKGSGKSAIADVLALLGNSRQKAHFSFLKKDRFRGRSGDPAKHFVGQLTWCDSTKSEEHNLNEDPSSDKVELVRYIPQGHFEELCNEHVSSHSNAFEQELRSVIFSHTDESIRLGALDFDQLIEKQEIGFRDRLGELHKELKKLNDEISNIEDQMQPNIRRVLAELLAVKNRQIEEHNKIKPDEKPKPTGDMTPEQQEASYRLDQITTRLKEIEQTTVERSSSIALLARKQNAVHNIRERTKMLERARKQFEDETIEDLRLLDLKAIDIVGFTINDSPLGEAISKITPLQEELNSETIKASEEKLGLHTEQGILNAKLNEPQLEYQKSVKAIEDWSNKLNELVGKSESPETLNGLKNRIQQIDALPDKHIERAQYRLTITAAIFEVLNEQREARARLFKPVQDLIQANSLIREEYKLQFQATLGGSSDAIANSLFALIKQNSGQFRGEDESYFTVRKIFQNHDFNTSEGVLNFVKELHETIISAASVNNSSIGIINLLRKDKSASEVYDLLFGLSFLEPRYSLLFQDAQIEQLSPGQRGALLLIFYLLVDKGKNPIILDQPEENLDNETIVNLLVPVLTEAKKKRQIIMVTHNPNLAIVCDAEQVIYSLFDRKGGPKITYKAGAIENPDLNLHAVNTLEGTKPAFDNRRSKYH